MAADWNRHAEDFLLTHQQHLWREHSDAVNTELLESWLPPGRSRRILKTDLFDEAVTEGLREVLLRRGDLVLGLDVSTRILQAVGSNPGPLSCLGADVRSLPLGDETIDVVVSLSTLDHFDTIDSIEESLGELYRVLVPGGSLILTLDNLANPVINIRNKLPYRVTHAAGLVPYPVGKTEGPIRISRLVENAGFDIEDVTSIMHAPRVVAIPVLGLLSRFTKGRFPAGVSRALRGFEALKRTRTRFLTGHFIAIRATKA
jgi:SAM-dependent methyltransferase